MNVRKVLLAAVWSVSVLGFSLPAVPAETLQRVHRDITLIAQPPPAGVKYDVGIVDPKTAMDSLQKAFDLLFLKSPFSKAAIETLQKNGKVFVVYDPKFPKKIEDMTQIAAAFFFPDYFKKRGGGRGFEGFLAVVTRHGIKWPTSQLAAILAHELVGHGMQQLRGRFGFIREVDLECEAWLYSEQAFQDLGVDKFSRDSVTFRQTMEYGYCPDFKTYMRQTDPGSEKLWDVLNPDVPRILGIFEKYAKTLSAGGVAGKAIKAAKQLRFEDRLRKIEAQGSAEELFGVAIAFRDGLEVPRDQKKALKWFLLAAKKGLKTAQLEMAFIYDKGLGVTPSKSQAAKWFYNAAAQGEAYAQFTLARRLGTGTGVRKNEAQAVKWYRMAAKQGFAIAQYHLARSYAKGKGIGKNANQAAQWQRQAADQGFALAQYQMGQKYAKGQGVAKDQAQAVKWFRKAALQGLALAQYYLAKNYAKGNGVAKDEGQAVKWYRMAADQGDARSQNDLGVMYIKGRGVAKNPAEAFKWYRKAAAKGHGKAQRSLGVIYEKGLGVKQDLVEAYKWLALAAQKKVKGAAKRRDAVAKRMTPAKVNRAKKLAAAWKKT